jgi:hypothetical protein
MRTPLFLLLVLLPLYSVANEKPFNIRGYDGFYKSVDAACAGFNYSSIAQPINLMNPTYAGSYNVIQNTSSFACKYNFTSHLYGDPKQPTRQGTSSGLVIVDTMPPCQAGTESTYTWPLGRLDTSAEFNIAPGTAITPPANACIDGCFARHVGVSSCFNSSQEEGSITYCDYNGKLTGEACSSSENQPPEVPQPTEPTDPTDPTNPTDPGDGGSTPGDGGTDPGNGGTTPGDGGTNPGGGGTSPGDGSTNPGGGGTTPGNGGTNPGGGDSNGGSASGLACESPLACSGDAVQCALLTVQKQIRCDAAAARDFPAQKDAISNFLDAQGDSAELDEGDGEIDVSGLFSGPTDARFLPAACPPPKSFSLTTMGRQNL